MSLFDIVRKALLAGFGAQEKVKEFIDELVKKGELSESEGAKIVKAWTEKAGKGTEQFTKNVSNMINKTLEKMNLPTKKDIEELNKKVETLSEMIKKLEGGEKSMN
ncbi:MAG: phasin family protein [Thermodesulfovibrionales bacterium]|nr:phasin family protein [Thermodesulfovibrionales bacterium]